MQCNVMSCGGWWLYRYFFIFSIFFQLRVERNEAGPRARASIMLVSHLLHSVLHCTLYSLSTRVFEFPHEIVTPRPNRHASLMARTSANAPVESTRTPTHIPSRLAVFVRCGFSTRSQATLLYSVQCTRTCTVLSPVRSSATQ